MARKGPDYAAPVRRILVSLSFPIYCLAAALLAWFLLRSAPDAAKYVALSFVAGLLTVAAVEDMLEEAHEAREDDRGSVLAFVGGFTLFTLVSAGLETVTGGDARASGSIDARVSANQNPRTTPNAAALAEGDENRRPSLLTFQRVEAPLVHNEVA